MCCSNAAWKREEVPDHKVCHAVRAGVIAPVRARICGATVGRWSYRPGGAGWKRIGASGGGRRGEGADERTARRFSIADENRVDELESVRWRVAQRATWSPSRVAVGRAAKSCPSSPLTS